MPIYEYQCKSCEKITELMQKFSDAPLEKCPECGGEVAKLMSMTSFALKGTGWYTTDYKRASTPPPSGGAKPAADAASSAAKTESAPKAPSGSSSGAASSES